MSSIYGSAAGANVIYGKNNYGVAFSAAVAPSVQYCQDVGVNKRGTVDEMVMGNIIESGNSVIDKECTALKVYLNKYGASPSGTVYARVWNSSHVIQHTWNSMLVSALVNDPDNQAETFTGAGYTISEGDIVGCEFDLSGSGATEMLDDDSSHSGWSTTRYYLGVWTDYPNRANRMCITGEA